MDALPTLDLSALRDAYLQRRLTPSALIDVLLQRIATTSDRNIWISLMPEAQLRQRASRTTSTWSASPPPRAAASSATCPNDRRQWCRS